MTPARPNSLKMAIYCLLVSYVVASVQVLLKLHWSDLKAYALGITGLLVSWLFVFLIYRGRNWARWLYAGFMTVWLVSLAADMKHTTQLGGGDRALLVLYLILGLTAVILLFTPASTHWFKSQKASVQREDRPQVIHNIRLRQHSADFTLNLFRPPVANRELSTEPHVVR
jgi:hypothetical protein